MNWIVSSIRPIMLVSGALTLTMVYAAIAPEAALRSNFGESLSGPVANIVVRNWGALIALIGAMLIYAAGKPALRPLAVTVAGVSKAIFAGLVLSYGSRFMGNQVGIAVIVDAIWVVVFAIYLLGSRSARPQTPTVIAFLLFMLSAGVLAQSPVRDLQYPAHWWAAVSKDGAACCRILPRRRSPFVESATRASKASGRRCCIRKALTIRA